MTADTRDLAPAGATAELDQLKRTARQAAKKRRAAAAARLPGAGEDLARQFLENVSISPGMVVSGFWPLSGEIDTLPLMTALHGRGYRMVLPVMQGPGKPLVFRAWAPGDSLVTAAFGTREPAAEQPEATPNLLLVPLLAFDRAGYRLGYGGGFFDRTLERLRTAGPVATVGLAFAGQEVPGVPRGPYDQRLDWIVTERECLVVGEHG